MGLSVVHNALKQVKFEKDNDTMSHSDIFKSGENLTSALCTMTNGHPRKTTYPFVEFSYILEGELHAVDDENPGEVVKLKAGDAILVQKGSAISWSTPGTATAYYVTSLE